MYVLDSSALIELTEDGPMKNKVEEILGDDPLVTTSITTPSAKRSAEIARVLQKSEFLINSNDILIAGIAQAHNAVIVTMDRDFEKIRP